MVKQVSVKRWQWICLGILSFSLAVWIVIYPYVFPISAHGLSIVGVGVVVVFAIHPLCALWLLVQAIRFEPKPMPYVLLALFVTFAFVWYYIEKVRQRKQAAQPQTSRVSGLSVDDDSLGHRIMRVLWICMGMFSLTFAVIMVFFYPFHRPFYEELGKARY